MSQLKKKKKRKKKKKKDERPNLYARMCEPRAEVRRLPW